MKDEEIKVGAKVRRYVLTFNEPIKAEIIAATDNAVWVLDHGEEFPITWQRKALLGDQWELDRPTFRVGMKYRFIRDSTGTTYKVLDVYDVDGVAFASAIEESKYGKVIEIMTEHDLKNMVEVDE